MPYNGYSKSGDTRQVKKKQMRRKPRIEHLNKTLPDGVRITEDWSPGKGSGMRDTTPEQREAYRKNFDLIDWGKK